MGPARQDLKIGSLGAYVVWGLNHRVEIQAIITNVQLMMVDFPVTAGAEVVPGTNIPQFLHIDSPEDAALRQAIMALPDGPLTSDNAVLNQLFDTSSMPQSQLGDGTFIKLLLENLPALIQLLQLFKSMFGNVPATLSVGTP